jgi:hypothetical protein
MAVDKGMSGSEDAVSSGKAHAASATRPSPTAGDTKGSDGFKSASSGADVGKGVVTDDAPVRTSMSATLVDERGPTVMPTRRSTVTPRDDKDVQRHTGTDETVPCNFIRDHMDAEEAGAVLEYYSNLAKLRLQEPGAL